MSEKNNKIMYKYPNYIQPFAEIQPPVVMLERPYIGDQLKEAQKRWTKEKAVILNCPTGCGKTQFVLSDCIRQYHAHEKAKILIVANRRLLLYLYKKEVAKITGEDVLLTEKGIAERKQFKNIYVVSYQGLQRFLIENKGIHFNVVIFDEIHFLLSDSLFSNCTGEIYRLIPQKFKNSIRIYMSATIDQVLPYILTMEIDPDVYSAENGYLYHMPTLESQGFSNTKLPLYACWNSQKQKFPDLNCEKNVPMPTIYKMEPDYSNIEIVFYDDEENLFYELKKSGAKLAIFLRSRKNKDDLKRILGDDAVYLDAKVVADNPELALELIKKESFDAEALAATTVFCNGNNIKDANVKNVVIEVTDPVDIIQMCGRRRLVGKNDGFTLYLRIPKLNEIENMLHNLWEFLNEIRSVSCNEVKLNSIVLNRYTELDKKVANLTYMTSYGKYKINELTNDVINMEISYLEKLKEIINDDGIEGYCRFISSSLFGKEFSDEMIFKPDYADKKAAFCALLDSYLNKKMNEKEFEDFSKIITEKRIELFGKSKRDNTGSNRNAPGMQALNNRFKELELPYEVQKTEDGYILVKTEI